MELFADIQFVYDSQVEARGWLLGIRGKKLGHALQYNIIESENTNY